LTASVVPPTDCSQAESCDLCVGDSMLNLTGCVWRLCPNGDTHVHTHTHVTSDSNSIIDAAVTLAPLVCDDSNTNSSPEFSQAKFDMSSFIGGIILVLCLQAGGFFAMRFLKSKDKTLISAEFYATAL
uniref:CD164 sialomucin-like 2 n=1 Tax=Oreochromis niloticus TaxID=8128 RepID=A0A669F6C7_ORENI